MVVGFALLLLSVFGLLAVESKGAIVASKFGLFSIAVIGVIFFLAYYLKSQQEKQEKLDEDGMKNVPTKKVKSNNSR